jgi:butyrate kinase
MKRVLAVNPGSASTKIAVYDDDRELLRRSVERRDDDPRGRGSVFDQWPHRLEIVIKSLDEAGIPLTSLDAVVGRGGLLKPLEGGTYAVDEEMLSDLAAARRGEHASNLGAVIAYRIAGNLGIPAFIVDPVSVDELEDEARLSGLPELPRESLSHALNSRAVARLVASEMGMSYGEANFVVAHLGSGISVSAHRLGRMIDVNNAREEGPFAPDRAGGLPSLALIRLCFSGEYSEGELRARMMGSGGMYAYLGTRDARTARRMARDGDERAALVLGAMAYQTAKEIGAMAAALGGLVDRVILTGGMAHDEAFVRDVSDRIGFVARVRVVPGEEELASLAMGALRVLRGEEEAKSYASGRGEKL